MNIKTLDLFCGGGGSSWGAVQAGASIILGVDGWDRAIETYSVNFGNRGRCFLMGEDTVPADLGLRSGEVDLILASPECTNHTCAKGSRKRDEDSKRTANYVLNFARDLEPKWIIIENVVHMKKWDGFGPLIEGLHGLDYGTSIQILDASKFGVPQSRRRLFILCARGRTPLPLTMEERPCPNAVDILDYDPRTGFDPHKSGKLFSERRAKSTIERFERGVAVLGKCKPFLLVYYGSDAAGGWQPLNRPLRTLTTLDRFGLITWQGDVPYLRMLQPPEIMRAMGFRDCDHYTLTGTRREQIKQLGNGVCPPVMQAIVTHLCEKKHKVERKFPKRVKVLSRRGVLA